MVGGRAEAPLDCQAKPPLIQEPKIRGERKKVLLGNNTIVGKTQVSTGAH